LNAVVDRPRVGKARKRARLAARQTRKLLAKHGHKIDPAHKAEVVAALERLEQADRDKDVVAIYEALKALDERVEERLGHVRKSPTREYFESIGVAVLIALFLRAFIVEAFTIPSGSMIPTLAVGDFLFVNKLAYGIRIPFTDKLLAQWSLPDRGDVIVFVYPCDPSNDFIKRVVGLPGDVIDQQNGFVTINGKPVAEKPDGEFLQYAAYQGHELNGGRCGHRPATLFQARLDDHVFNTLHCEAAPPDEAAEAQGTPFDWSGQGRFQMCPAPQVSPFPFPWKVPDGHVFVMGDNRDNSSDSRYWGFVPVGAIKGKALFIWLSWDSPQPWSQFWKKIRWNRLGQPVHHGP
jgi:signal peptidase I